MKRLIPLVAAIALLVSWAGSAAARTLRFSGYDWAVTDGTGLGPGPNDWSPANAWVDARGYLHLALTQSGGHWWCAQVALTRRLGFGRFRLGFRGGLRRLG